MQNAMMSETAVFAVFAAGGPASGTENRGGGESAGKGENAGPSWATVFAALDAEVTQAETARLVGAKDAPVAEDSAQTQPEETAEQGLMRPIVPEGAPREEPGPSPKAGERREVDAWATADDAAATPEAVSELEDPAAPLTEPLRAKPEFDPDNNLGQVVQDAGAAADGPEAQQTRSDGQVAPMLREPVERAAEVSAQERVVTGPTGESTAVRPVSEVQAPLASGPPQSAGAIDVTGVPPRPSVAPNVEAAPAARPDPIALTPLGAEGRRSIPFSHVPLAPRPELNGTLREKLQTLTGRSGAASPVVAADETGAGSTETERGSAPPLRTLPGTTSASPASTATPPAPAVATPPAGVAEALSAVSPNATAAEVSPQFSELRSLAPTAGQHGLAPLPQPQGSPAMAQQVASQIAEISRPLPDGPIELSLQPEELGRLRLSFSAGEAGLQVVVSAERPETLEMMRRHIDVLAQEMRRLGHEGAQFSFSGGQNAFRDQATGGQGNGQRVSWSGDGGSAMTDAADPVGQARLTVRSAGLDLRL